MSKNNNKITTNITNNVINNHVHVQDNKDEWRTVHVWGTTKPKMYRRPYTE